MNDKFSSDPNDRVEAQIADYVRGTLDEAAAEALELDLLEDPQLLARVEEQALLQRGLRITPLEAPAPVQRLRWRWPGFALMGALCLALTVLAGWNLQLNHQLSELRSPRSAVPVITLFEERSLLDSTAPQEPMSKAGPVLIEIDVSADGNQNFELELVGSARSFRWQGVRPDERGYLTIYVPEAIGLERLTVLDAQSNRVREFELP